MISEDDIEQAMLQRLQHLYGYDALICFTADPPDLNDGSGRTDKRDVILHDRLQEAAIALNPGIPESAIDDALKRLCDKRQTMSSIAANHDLDGLIRDGVQVQFKDQRGRNRKEWVKVIDFNNPENNRFLAVTQLWIQSTGAAPRAGYRRPDILLYFNGLPNATFLGFTGTAVDKTTCGNGTIKTFGLRRRPGLPAQIFHRGKHRGPS